MKAPKTVESIMTRDIVAFSPDSSVVTASRVLASKHVGGAPVIDEKGRPVGVVTLTDLVDPDRQRSDGDGESLYYRVVDGKCDPIGAFSAEDVPGEGIVSDVMSPYAFSVSPETTLMQAIRLMVSDNIHRLLVVDSGKLVGVVSSMDMLKAMDSYADDQ
jgi:CBS domain-containing protein